AGPWPQAAASLALYRPWPRPREAKPRRPHYVAFVLRQGKEPVRVELGPAEPIEKALAAWRQDIARGRDSPAAAELRHLLWDQLAPHVPSGPGSTIYLCPDGELSALPWAALPGRVPGTVLLEEHALALVPHAPCPLPPPRQQGPRPPGAGRLLARGGARSARPPDAVHVPADLPEPVRPAQRSLEVVGAAPLGTQRLVWPALPGTAREAAHVSALAQRLPQVPQVLQRAGTQAGTGQLLLDLPQARWAHLATHGF